MALTVLAWVLRTVSLAVFAFSLWGFVYGLRVEPLLPVGGKVVQPGAIRLLQGVGLLALAVSIWLLAGWLQGRMQLGFGLQFGLIILAGVTSSALVQDVKRRLPPKPSGHLNALEVAWWILLFVAIMAGDLVAGGYPEGTVHGLVDGVVLFVCLVGGTFIAWAVARAWVRLKGPPEPQPPYGMV
jgi:hypothetical protein